MTAVQVSPEQYRELVCSLIPAVGQDLLLVGGTVRELLLGRLPRDLDAVVIGSPALMLQHGFKLVEGKTTTPIYFKPDSLLGKIEITLLSSHDELQRDLCRRDFRCNAIAMHPVDGSLVDPLGGYQDVKAMRLAPCSAACFSDDPARIYRTFRFESEGWYGAPELYTLLGNHEWGEQLAGIPRERFTREMLKALEAARPSQFFRRMLENNVGAVILPELFEAAGEVADAERILTVLDRVAERTAVSVARLAGLFVTVPDAVGLLQTLHDRLHLSSASLRVCLGVSKILAHLERWPEMPPIERIELAEQAVRIDAADWLEHLAIAAVGMEHPLPEWWRYVRVATMSSRELGVELEQLQCIPVVERSVFLRKQKCERLYEVQ